VGRLAVAKLGVARAVAVDDGGAEVVEAPVELAEEAAAAGRRVQEVRPGEAEDDSDGQQDQVLHGCSSRPAS
jgi:hypothetical protein